LYFKNSIPNQLNQKNKTKTPKRKFQTQEKKTQTKVPEIERKPKQEHPSKPKFPSPKDSNQNPNEE
jgi:hypothetical protein